MAPMGGPPKKSWYTKWWGIGLIAFGALVLVSVVFGSAGTDTSATDSPGSTNTEPAPTSNSEEPAVEEPTEPDKTTEPAAEETAVAGVGDRVRDGKFEFVVTDVKTGVRQVGDDFLDAKAQGQFTLVTLKVKNIGDEPQTFFSDNLKGTDSKGREVGSDSTATLYANEGSDAWISEINPGNSIKAVVVFDVAKNAKLVSLEVHDSAFSGGATISLK